MEKHHCALQTFAVYVLHCTMQPHTQIAKNLLPNVIPLILVALERALKR